MTCSFNQLCYLPLVPYLIECKWARPSAREVEYCQTFSVDKSSSVFFSFKTSCNVPYGCHSKINMWHVSVPLAKKSAPKKALPRKHQQRDSGQINRCSFYRECSDVEGSPFEKSSVPVRIHLEIGFQTFLSLDTVARSVRVERVHVVLDPIDQERWSLCSHDEAPIITDRFRSSNDRITTQGNIYQRYIVILIFRDIWTPGDGITRRIHRGEQRRLFLHRSLATLIVAKSGSRLGRGWRPEHSKSGMYFEYWKDNSCQRQLTFVDRDGRESMPSIGEWRSNQPRWSYSVDSQVDVRLQTIEHWPKLTLVEKQRIARRSHFTNRSIDVPVRDPLPSRYCILQKNDEQHSVR